MQLGVGCRSLSLSTLHSLLLVLVLILVATSAIIEIANLFAVEQRFVHSLVDNVVGETQPSGGGVAAARLRRVLGKHLLEVRGALATGVESGKEVHEGLEGHAIVLGRLIREARHHCVEELPRRVAKFGPTGRELLADASSTVRRHRRLGPRSHRILLERRILQLGRDRRAIE